MSRTVPSTTDSTVVEPVTSKVRVGATPSGVATSIPNRLRTKESVGLRPGLVRKLNRSVLMSGLFASLTAAAVACSSSPAGPTAGDAVETTSVEITPAEVRTPGGLRVKLKAVVRDGQGNAMPDEVEWSTTDPTVASVDSDGTVWSFKSGSTSATATFPGKSGSSGGKAYGRAKKDATIEVVDDSPDRPGRVTDLAVKSTTASAATLSFTEVGDGQGGAAEYLVRRQVAPLSWSSATDATAGSCAAPLPGSGEGVTVSCTVENLSSETAHQFQVVAIRTADGIHGDLSNVASGTTPGAESFSGSGTYPNEPAGLSTIASVDFTNGITAQTGVCTEHSDAYKRANSEYVTDATAPTGDGAVFQGKFPSGMADGRSSWRFDCWGPGMDAPGGRYDYRELYVTYWLKIEGSDYQNQTVGTKTHYIAYGSTSRQNHSAPFLDGTFNDQAIMTNMTYAPYVYEMKDDGSDAGGGAVRRTPNVTGYSNKVGVGGWTQVELYYRINDIGPTKDNGVLRVWINGTLTHEETEIRYRSDMHPLGFYHFQFTPVYGGNSGDVRTRDDYWRLDQVYISGRA
jgi:hypothetical protein